MFSVYFRHLLPAETGEFSRWSSFPFLNPQLSALPLFLSLSLKCSHFYTVVSTEFPFLGTLAASHTHPQGPTSSSLALLQLSCLIPFAQQVLLKPVARKKDNSCSAWAAHPSPDSFLPFPACFQVFSHRRLASRLLHVGFALSLPPGRPSFPFQLLVPFHCCGEPVFLQALCACQLTRPGASSCPHPMLFRELSAQRFPRGLEGRVPRLPFLPSRDLAWSRAAGNWNCRSSSGSCSLGL